MTPWVHNDTDSWRTSYSRVSWAYDPTPVSLPTEPHYQQTVHQCMIPPLYAKPPHYHASLFVRRHISPFHPAGSGTRGSTSQSCPQIDLLAEDDNLNPDLIGVKRANDVLAIYEAHVGFDSALTTVSDLGPAFRRRCRLTREVDVDLVTSEKERWQEMTRDFISDALCSRPEKEMPSESSSERATVQQQLPSDPKILHSTDIEVLPVDSVHSTRPSTPSLIFTNFTFPSLNDSRDSPASPRTPPKQVSRGLHHDRPSTKSTKPSSNSPKSKTRALVTMLRAAAASKVNKPTPNKSPISSPSSSPRPADSPSSSNASHNVDLDFFSHTHHASDEDGMETISSRSSPSPCEHKGDGWIRTSSAGPSSSTGIDQPAEAWIIPEKPQSTRPSPKTSTQPPSLPVNDDEGWIEGPSHSHYRGNKNGRKPLNRTPHAPMPPPPLPPAAVHSSVYPYIMPMPITIPPPFMYPANTFYAMPVHHHPHAAAAQMHIQPLSRAVDGNWYSPQPVFLPGLPRFIPGPPGPSPMVPLRYPGVPLVGPGPITGASGMRHTVW